MDRHYLIDLVFSIAQDCADEWHDKEILSSLEQERNTIDPEELPGYYQELTKQIKEAKKDYVDGVRLRRFKMDILAEKSPAYDYTARCRLKHRATSFVQATEVYLADPCDDTYHAMVASERRFWRAVGQFMGVEKVVPCGRCLSDQLKKIEDDE